MMQFAHRMVGLQRRGVAAVVLAAGLLGMAAPAAAQNTVPDAELNVKAGPGDEKVSLHFKEPDDGGSPITRYEYRGKVATGSYPATWTRVPEFTGNVGATLDLFVVVESLAGGTALANGTEYAFQVRAVNGVGAGMPDEDTATPQVNVPATYTIGPEQGIIERRPLAPAPRVPADQHVSLLGAINDPDGIDAARNGIARFTYEWEWIRVRTGVETVIAGAGSGDRGERTTEYVLTPADVGSQIKARVRYRDDRYNAEEFVTALFPASGTILPAAACAAPTYTGGAAEIWQDELKIEDIDHADATPNRYGVFGSRMFTAGSNTYEIDGIYRETVGADADKLSFGLADKDLTGTDKNQLILYVCDEAYPLIDATLLPTRHNYLWPDTDDWSTYLTRTIHLAQDAVAPTVTRARISGASLTLTFSENLDDGSIPATTAFTVEVGGEPAQLEAGSTAVISGSTVTLTLAEAPPSSSRITVDYAQPGTGNLRDNARNETADFTATVTRPRPPPPPGDPPEFLSTPYVFDLQEGRDGSAVPVALGTVRARDPDGGSVVYALASGNSSRFAVDSASGAVTYIGPGEDLDSGPGQYALQVRATDSDGRSATAAVEIRVTPGNEAPLAVDDAAETAEDTPVTIAVLANDSDPDGDTLTVVEVSAPAHGTAVVADAGEVVYTPEPGYHGTDRFTYVVGDGSGLTAQAAVEVTVLAAPLTVDDAVETAEDTPVTIDVLANDSDPDGDTLTVVEVSAPAHGTAVLADAGEVVYTPEPDYHGTDRFTYVVRDESGLTTQAAVEVTVLPVNDPPLAVDDAAETAEDTPATIAVLANDSDPDGDTLTVVEVSAPAHGTATPADTGAVVYTPEPDYHGIDRFTYVVGDGSGLTAQAAVELTVLPVNDPPLATGVIPDQTLEAGDGPASLDLSPFFEDRDGDALGYTAVASDQAVALSLSGAALTLTVARPGAATVTVTAQDPGGLTATQAFLVTTSDRQAQGVVEDTLAALGRGHLASARATLGRRVETTGQEQSRVTVAGLHVPLGTGLGGVAAAGQAVAERWITGLAGSMPLRSGGWSGPGGGASPGALGAAGAPGAPGSPAGAFGIATAAAPFGAAGPAPLGAGASTTISSLSRLSPLGGGGQTDFLLALGSGQAGGGATQGQRWTVWGQLDLQAFEGERSPAARYDGDLRTAYVGVDARLGERWLAGVAVSRSRGDGDWNFGSSTGRLTTNLTSVQPYLRWSDGGTTIWATAGGGAGTAENERVLYGLQEESDLGLRLGLVEVRRRLATVGGGVELQLRGDASWARLATAAGDELIDALEVDAQQLRVGIDVRRPVRTAGGTLVEPFGEVHARHDGGSGQTGFGLEVAGGMRVARGVFRVEGMGRLLALHAADGYREHGGAVTLSVGDGARQPGLTLSLSPRWGAPAAASDALWQDQLFHRRAPGAPGARRDEQALDARVDYGLLLPAGGLLTPFGIYGQSQYGRRMQVGLLLSRVGPVGLEVSGERYALLDPGREEYRMSALGSITFGGADNVPAGMSAVK